MYDADFNPTEIDQMSTRTSGTLWFKVNCFPVADVQPGSRTLFLKRDHEILKALRGIIIL